MPESTVMSRAHTSSGTSIDLQSLIGLRREALRLDLAPRARVLATRSGGHLSHFRGRGVEFDESRVYLPGDDPRNMDWRVTARTGTAHVKMFREERERPVWLLVDQGTSMQFGTRVAFKSVVAAQAAALLAWAASDQGDRVGGMVFDHLHHAEQRPLARSSGVLPLLKALSSDSHNRKGSGFGSVSEAAANLSQRIRPGSLVFLLSDFVGLSERDASWLAPLARASEVVCIHISDPLEQQAPPPGRYPVSDGQHFGLLDTAAHLVQQQWRELFTLRLQQLHALTRRYALHSFSLATDQAVGATLRHGLQPGRRMPQGGTR